MHFWPQNTECLIQEGPDAEDNSPMMSSAHQGDAVVPASPQSSSNVGPSKDFIRCLPLQLSMYILGKAALIFPKVVSPKGHGWGLTWTGVSHSVLLIPQGFWIKNPSMHVLP